MHKKTNNKGFTLIEIMVVVIILGTLIAIVAPNFIGRVGDAQITAAKQVFRTFLKNWSIDVLVNKPIGQSSRNWRGPYLDRLPEDPWGNRYMYAFPGMNSEFDVYSYGRDGIMGGDDEDADIGNWMN